MPEEEKEEKGVFLVQREGRISIPRDIRQSLSIQQGNFVALSIRKASDEQILEALKKT